MTVFTTPGAGFSLAHTIASGQLFRYSVVAEGFLVAHGSRAFVISQDERTGLLTVHAHAGGVDELWLRHFFALDEDLPQATDAYSRAALAYCDGLRICNQEPWECLLGFICSQNNNLARIRQLMTGLARTFGKPLAVGEYTAYAIPDPGSIRAGRELDSIKAGYRAQYLVRASERLSYELLEGVFGHSYEEAKVMLLLIDGVGPKVADCILLFAYGHTEAFPIDTWVEHIMRTQYRCKTKEDMRRKAQKLWGVQAGIMQQYLFHYARTA